MKLTGLDHIVLCVADVERTLAFYEKVLGMEPREERPGKWSLHFGSNKISVQDARTAPEIARETVPGSGNFCVLTDEPVERVAEALRRHGLQVVAGPDERDGATGKILSVYFRDPDGNLVEVSNRLSQREAAQGILEFWFARAADDPAEASARGSFWFGASRETDSLIRERFGSAVEAAARGELDSWVQAPRSALALVLLLDQFPRNIWRGTAKAFAHDARALWAAREAVARGHLRNLAPIEQAFLVLPFQHSESIDDQRESVRFSSEIARAAPAVWRPLLEDYLRFAKEHLALIERFGRFPHRNQVLGRAPTAEEAEYSRGGGASFGQGAG